MSQNNKHPHKMTNKEQTAALTLTTLPSALKLEAKLNTLLDRDQKEHHTAGGHAYLTGPDGGPLSGTEAEALIREGEEVFLHVQVNHWHHGRNGRRGDSCFEDHVSTFSFFNNLKAEQEGTGSGDGYEIVTYRVTPLSATKLKNLTDQMPFNLAGETLPEMTDEEWESYCRTFVEENRRKIQEAHANRNSTAPFNN